MSLLLQRVQKYETDSDSGNSSRLLEQFETHVRELNAFDWDSDSLSDDQFIAMATEVMKSAASLDKGAASPAACGDMVVGYPFEDHVVQRAKRILTRMSLEYNREDDENALIYVMVAIVRSRSIRISHAVWARIFQRETLTRSFGDDSADDARKTACEILRGCFLYFPTLPKNVYDSASSSHDFVYPFTRTLVTMLDSIISGDPDVAAMFSPEAIRDLQAVQMPAYGHLLLNVMLARLKIAQFDRPAATAAQAKVKELLLQLPWLPAAVRAHFRRCAKNTRIPILPWPTETCAQCRKKVIGSKICSACQCKTTRYCSVACQLLHWNSVHKHVCCK